MTDSENQKKPRKKASKNISEAERVFGSLSRKIDNAPAFNPQQHKDETRAAIALYFVKGFFWMVGACLVTVPYYNLIAASMGAETISLKDILPAISGLISGPLGFVIGHYFKSDK